MPGSGTAGIAPPPETGGYRPPRRREANERTIPSPSGWTEVTAARFRAVSEPTRLMILYALRQGERSVTELVEATGLHHPNASKHLQLLHRMGFVRRRKQGLFVYYALADEEVLRLCEVMYHHIEAEHAERNHLLRASLRGSRRNMVDPP